MNKETLVSKAPKALKNLKPLKSKHNNPLSHGVGRRKSSIARVWIKTGNGTLTINNKDYKDYFDTMITRETAILPFNVYGESTTLNAVVNVYGGGLSSQADAVKLGIARALVLMNPDIRPMLREHNLLTVDSRLKERKKYGQKAARRKFQFVKR